MADLGVLELATGGGEPFLHPEWEKLFRVVTEVGLNLIITTNGLRLTPDVIQTLKEVEPLEVRVSFDGGPNLHEHVRGRNTYSRALRGLRLLSENGLHSAARLTLCSGVEDELPVLFGDLVATGVKQVKIAMVKRAGRAATIEGSHLLDTLPDKRYAANLVLLGQQHGLSVQLSADDFPLSILDAGDPKLRDAETRNCGAGLETCYITPRGQLLGCVVIPNIGFGRLDTQSFREVWEGRIAANYRLRAGTVATRRLCDSVTMLKSDADAIMPISRGVIPLEII
jgi:MoaA/NifB/PqqE/SkfB family radical SAM enzyme